MKVTMRSTFQCNRAEATGLLARLDACHGANQIAEKVREKLRAQLAQTDPPKRAFTVVINQQSTSQHACLAVWVVHQVAKLDA